MVRVKEPLAAIETKRRVDWLIKPPTGGFGPANQFEPTRKPRPHFKETSRGVYGRLFQCRTGHGFMGEYYLRHRIDEPVECPCGEDFQTREHILFDCPRYDDHRHLLQVGDGEPTLQQVLGTNEGLKCLVEFLKASRAFTKTGGPPDEDPQD